MEKKIIENTVRNIPMKFVAYNRSLGLCARMNYETENLDFIDCMNPGEVYYDLGACEGRFSIYAALKGIICYTFEPENKNFSALIENLELNELIGKNNIHAFQLGVGEKKKQAIMKIGQPWAGGHQKVIDHDTVRNDLNFNFVDKQIVNIVSLDEFISENNYPFPNYLKIDIDGSEIPFLLGAQNTLKSKELKKILFELSTSDRNYSMIISLLEKNKFSAKKFFPIPNEKNLFNVLFEKIQ